MQPFVLIKIETRYASKWYKSEGSGRLVWCRGAVHADGRFYWAGESAHPFCRLDLDSNETNQHTISSFFDGLNGFFATVIKKSHAVLAAVDHVRSIPLYYGQAKGTVFLSDDAEWVRQKINDTEIDPLAHQEFLLTGYVTRQETLFPRVRQIQAGEFVLITRDREGAKIQKHRYSRFFHTKPSIPLSEEDLLNELSALSEKSVRRLIEYAGDRQIVVPLSGGYDSRLIATLLKKLNYGNVLTFSYGAPENDESNISRTVAESLDYRWEFVNYSNTLWRTCWNTDERLNYQWWAAGWTSIPHIQDWPAVWKLKNSGKLEKDAVFAPGHTADLLSGSRSLVFPALYNEGTMEIERVIDAIYKFHYSLFPASDIGHDTKSFFKEKISDVLKPISDFSNSASAFECWDVSERQAKFIINSVRVYEFWGYDWYLPFWDKDFMHFWQRVPLFLRRNRRLYIRMVDRLYNQQRLQTRNTPSKRVWEKMDPFSPLRVFLRNSSIKPLLISIYDFYLHFLYYYKHPLRWFGIHDFFSHVKIKSNNINSVLVLLFFSDIAKRGFIMPENVDNSG